jgi:hypothetical protein
MWRLVIRSYRLTRAIIVVKVVYKRGEGRGGGGRKATKERKNMECRKDGREGGRGGGGRGGGGYRIMVLAFSRPHHSVKEGKKEGKKHTRKEGKEEDGIKEGHEHGAGPDERNGMESWEEGKEGTWGTKGIVFNLTRSHMCLQYILASSGLLSASFLPVLLKRWPCSRRGSCSCSHITSRFSVSPAEFPTPRHCLR